MGKIYEKTEVSRIEEQHYIFRARSLIAQAEQCAAPLAVDEQVQAASLVQLGRL